MLCDYGCNSDAKFQLKNGKWCCSEKFGKCVGYRKKLSNLRKGKTSPHKGKNRIYSEEARKKMGDVRRGKLAWNSGKKKCFNDETIEKMKNSHTGLSYITEDGRKRQREYMLNGGSEKANKNNKIRKPLSEDIKEKIRQSKIGSRCSERCKEINRQRMLNGQSLRMIKSIKKISNEEFILRNLVKELHSNCEFQYPVFRYSIDIVIPELKIAIEYDGYYHFDTEEHKEYHKNRQIKIENEGWKFLRYNIFQKFPSKEQIKEDIIKIIGDK
jgi:very-short-patch-repair endonuclease